MFSLGPVTFRRYMVVKMFGLIGPIVSILYIAVLVVLCEFECLDLLFLIEDEAPPFFSFGELVRLGWCLLGFVSWLGGYSNSGNSSLEEYGSGISLSSLSLDRSGFSSCAYGFRMCARRRNEVWPPPLWLSE